MLPLSSSAAAAPAGEDGPPSPYRAAAALLTTLHHFAAGFLAYAAWQSSGLAALALGAAAGGALAAAGTLCLVFAGEGGVSRRTGRDKRSSGMLFGGRRPWEKGRRAEGALREVSRGLAERLIGGLWRGRIVRVIIYTVDPILEFVYQLARQ